MRDEIENDVFNRDALELRIDRDEIETALFIRFNVVQVAVGFCPNDKWQVGYQRTFLARDTATAFRLEAFGDEAHRVGCIGKAFELQIEFSPSIVVGFFLAQLDRLRSPLFLVVTQRIKKNESTKFRKTKFRRGKIELGGNTPIRGGSAVKLASEIAARICLGLIQP